MKTKKDPFQGPHIFYIIIKTILPNNYRQKYLQIIEKKDSEYAKKKVYVQLLVFTILASLLILYIPSMKVKVFLASSDR